MIYCIGDSHSSFFSGEEKMQPVWPENASNLLPFFKSYRIGPATAYNLKNKKNIIENIINSNDFYKDDYLMFCFGEVDVRAHLIKQKNIQMKSIEEVVECCADRYINEILEYTKYKIKIIVWGVIASWHDNKPYTGGPSYGTNVERNIVTEIFNNYLESKCKLINIDYIDIFSEMINSNYETKVEFLDNWEGSHIHLSQYAMPLVVQKFKERGFIK